MTNIKAAAVQFEPVQADKQANLDIMARSVEDAASQGVELRTFPECCITGYWFLRNLTVEQLRDLAEPAFTGPSSRALAEMSRARGMTIGAGFVELADDGRMYNAYVVAMPDGQMRSERAHV